MEHQSPRGSPLQWEVARLRQRRKLLEREEDVIASRSPTGLAALKVRRGRAVPPRFEAAQVPAAARHPLTFSRPGQAGRAACGRAHS